MRTLAKIDADIEAATARLAELRAERAGARQDGIDRICSLFGAGLSPRQIAREAGTTVAAVQGILWRAGRTLRGRVAARQRIQDFVQKVSP